MDLLRARKYGSIWVLLAAALLTGSCTSSGRTVGGFDLDTPRVSSGVLAEDPPEDGLERMARKLDELEVASAETNAPFAILPEQPATLESGSPEAEIPMLGADGSLRTAPPALKPRVVPEPEGGSDSLLQWPARPKYAPAPENSGKLIALPKLNQTEQNELMASIALKLETELAYEQLPPPTGMALPKVPSGVTQVTELIRETGGDTRVIRFGLRRFLSQPAQLWAQGVVHVDGLALAPNPEVERIPELVLTTTTTVAEMKKELTRDDLAFKLIQLSYIDLKGAIDALKGFGLEAVESPSQIQLPLQFASLPVVAQMPAPDDTQTELLGSDTQKGARTAFDISVTPSVATKLPGDPNLAPASQLLVYYHPAYPEQFTRVKRLLELYVDRPARQVFIEGMVLEISEEGLKELGVEWEFREGSFDIVLGNLVPSLPATSTADMNFDSLNNVAQQWVVRLRALIEEQKAEVLSRPSVLTLNNRQATIRVGQEIPIATSQESGLVRDVNKIAFDFKYLATGISLNIRPRVTEEGDEVSMLVDTIVSGAIPGADLELRSNTGQVLASAPTVATRRVQTYSRIANNTPFIIGGLVSREHTVTRRKVPLLGDIPYLGVLFRSNYTESRKQEVIIVLTPHVLPDRAWQSAWGRYLPKDESRFDDYGNALFRDAYRIRAEDVFDLSFLERNTRLQRYRRLALDALEIDFRRATEYPFSAFVDNRIPGESVLVERMIYEVIKRLSEEDGNWLGDRVNLDRIIFFSGQHAGGYEVQFIERVLANAGDGVTHSSFFPSNPGQALAITFRRGQDAIETGSLTKNPIPTVRLMTCVDEKQWGELLWELNQPGDDGIPRYTILIHRPEDLVRLQRAVLLKNVISLNGGKDRVDRQNFGLGKVLLTPDANPSETHLLDYQVAEYFFHTEHYYAAALERINTVLRDFDQVFSRPELRHLQ